MKSLSARGIQVVVKVSKYCNLRCTYCYEYRELGDKRRMQLDRLRRFFANIAAYAANGLESVSFIWHGGEPFLIPLDYYDEIYRLQQEILAGRVKFSNVVQTNLTVLTERHISCLAEGRLFRGLGISFDVCGDQRVDTKGELRTDVVLANMQRLIDRGLRFGAIAVLARNTLPHVREIYRFYDSLGIESRFLPYYMSASDEQVSCHALTHDEITDALKAIFDAWLVSERATPVEPISEYIRYALSHMTGAPKRTHDKSAEEYVYIVNLDGGTWGLGEAYDPAYRYGNLFEDELGHVLASPNRRRAVREAEDRMRTYCQTCPYFGSCPGEFVADATPEQRRLLAEAGCPVRTMIDHMIRRFDESGVGAALAAAPARTIDDAAFKVSL
jgi:uncharacterized protein